MVDIGALFQGGMAGFDRGMEFHNLQLKQEEAVRKKKAEARKTKKDNLDFLRTLNSTLTIGLNESFGENATISPEGHFGSEWVRLRGDSIRAIITANNPNGEPSTPFQNALIKMLAGQTASRLKGLTRVLTQAGMRGVDLRKALRLSHDDPELFNKLFGTWIADAEDREQKRRERRRFVNPPEAVDPSEGVADPGVVKHLDLPTAVQTPAPESVPVDAGADAGASESGLVPTPILDKRIVELDKQIATLAQTLKEGYARGASQTDMSGPQKQYDGLVGLRKDIVTQRDKRKDQGLNVEKQELDERKHTADELYKRQSPEQRIQHQLNKLNVKYDYLPLDQWPDTDEGRSDRDMHATLTKTLKKATALLPPRIAAPGKAAVVKQFTDMRGKIIAAATDSYQRQGLISTLRVALDNNTWEPGILSSFRLMLAEAGSYLLDEKQNGLLNGMLESLSGAKGARIGELQRSISNLLVMDAYKNAAGGQINMREAKVIEGGSTRLGMTPDGQKLLLDVLERRGEYDRALKAELDRLTADFTNEDWDNPARHGKVMKEITKWRLDNPVFTEELKKKLANLPDATSDIPQHVMKRVGIRNAGDCIWLGMKSKGHFFEGEKKENPFSEGSSIFNCELDKDGQRADYIVEVTVKDYLYHTPHARE